MILVAVWSLLLLPAVVMLFLLFFVWSLGPRSLTGQVAESGGVLGVASVAGTSCIGMIALAPLILRFFHRCDSRWRRACGGICAAFGILASLSLLDWLLFAFAGIGITLGGDIVTLVIAVLMPEFAIDCAMVGPRVGGAGRPAREDPPPREGPVVS